MKIALRFLATAGLLPLGVVLSVTAYAQSDTMGAIFEKLTQPCPFLRPSS